MKYFLKRHWHKLAVVAVITPILGFLGLCLVIGLGVNSAVSSAQALYPADPVTALVSVMNSAEASLPDRNRAIWALGQLGAPGALSSLQYHVSDQPCDHETRLCQKELKKAIEGCSGGPNIGAFVWRHGELAVAEK